MRLPENVAGSVIRVAVNRAFGSLFFFSLQVVSSVVEFVRVPQTGSSVPSEARCLQALL